MKIILLIVAAMLMIGCGKEPASGGGSETNPATPEIFQIGESWSRFPLASEIFQTANEKTIDAFKAVALVKSYTQKGTAFYLGKIDGRYLMATNFHVFENDYGCYLSLFKPLIKFPHLGKSFFCRSIIGSWKEIDLTIFSITVPLDDQPVMNALKPLRFDFNSGIKKNQELMTLGFGSHQNPEGDLTAVQDKDCRVYSDTNTFRIMNNPHSQQDFMNDAYITSLAHGCDMSHGDSGSPLIDRKTGKVVGLNWAIGGPKNYRVMTRDYLNELEDSEEKWEFLNYAVPSYTIGRHLKKWTDNPYSCYRNCRAIKIILML